MKKLSRAFFKRNTLIVAEELLGKILVYKDSCAMITETEAYMGFDDPASHAHRGKTPRNQIMFGAAGYSYVYLIYGMYNCFNIVTEVKDFPAAVLIRAVQLLDNSPLHLNGPGKICKHFGITREHYGIDLTTHSEFYIACMQKKLDFIQTPRIGIKVGLDKHWRFLAKVT